MNSLKFFVNDGEICSSVSLNILTEIPSEPPAFPISRVIKGSFCAQDLIRAVISKRIVS